MPHLFEGSPEYLEATKKAWDENPDRTDEFWDGFTLGYYDAIIKETDEDYSAGRVLEKIY